MKSVKMHVSRCEIGNMLARDVFNDKGVLLANKNTFISDSIRSKLTNVGIEFIWVYDTKEGESIFSEKNVPEKLKASYRESVSLLKEALHDLIAGKHLDYAKISYISRLVFKNLQDIDGIIEYLHSLKAYDNYTFFHSVNVAFYSMLIGKWTRMSEQKILEIITAGLLHDIGKMKIPEVILNKRGTLTGEEFEIVKGHSTSGYDMIRGMELRNCIKEAVLTHHERMDGSGYPNNAAGDSIGEYARIIAVADTYDAMTSERVYKKKSTPFEAFQMFQTSGLKMFEHSISRTFISNMASSMVGMKVQLNTGEIGEIVHVPPHKTSHPIIRVHSLIMDLSKRENCRIVTVL